MNCRSLKPPTDNVACEYRSHSGKALFYDCRPDKTFYGVAVAAAAVSTKFDKREANRNAEREIDH